MRAKLTIDLSIIKDNYNYLQNITKAKVAAAVKSDAYGLSARKIAPALFDAGCRDFFVAHLEEGIEARECLPSIDANIYILNGPKQESVNIFEEYKLIPSLSTVWQIDLWKKLCPKAESIIHIDTGMNRFGISAEDFARLETLPEGVEYLISHLACDGDASNPYNKYQLDKFIKATAAYPHIKKSLAASGGILLGPEYHFDMVRPGAALYGIGASVNPNIKNPISLTAPIIQINYCNDDAYIGYGSTAKVKAGSSLATVPVGYADGFSRSLGNKGHMFIDGVKVPIMGRLSMDLTVLDVTGVSCNIGDTVEIIGPNSTPDQIASLTGTVGYEVITSLKYGRYDREFV